jgi:D-erythronate 2-dehydrogenase
VRIAITGGAGFLGASLARELLAAGRLAVDGRDEPVDRLLLLDIAAAPDDLLADPRVVGRVGGLDELLGDLDADVVFHLAGVVSGAAEADDELGMATNVDGTRAVIRWARTRSRPPLVVFSSSVAVFGIDPAGPPVDVVGDDTLPRPQSSYGTQKFVGELLIADATRKGYLRGRSVRLITVSVRPGRPNAAASSFLSGIIREPVAGLRAPCPVPRDTPVAISSRRCTLDGLLRAAGATASEWGSTTAVTLPAITTTPGAMAAALDRIAGAGTSDLIDWVDDPGIRAIVASWPARIDAARARALGLHPEESVDAIVAAHLRDVGRTPV